ncbi:hypothetical protein D918_09533 [Trichuris suis]|nr:hypothetical protein D918_09533 [Trichuris suis]
MDAEHGLIEDPRAPDKFVLETESDSYGPGTAQVLRRYPRVQDQSVTLIETRNPSCFSPEKTSAVCSAVEQELDRLERNGVTSR